MSHTHFIEMAERLLEESAPPGTTYVFTEEGFGLIVDIYITGTSETCHNTVHLMLHHGDSENRMRLGHSIDGIQRHFNNRMDK